MTVESVQVIDTLNDQDFLTFARLFGRGSMNLQEYVTLRDKVKKRCNSLGYAWTQGCCGTHTLTPIQYANKK